MPLSEQQIRELNIADDRRRAGTATATDIANLDFARDRGFVSDARNREVRQGFITPTTAATVDATTPTAPTAPTVSQEPTVGQITQDLGTFDPSFGGIDPDRLRAEQLLQDSLNIGAVDEESIRRQKMLEAQAQIDALDAMFAKQFERAQQERERQVGRTTAIQARRGLVGTGFGGAQQSRVQGRADEIEEMIQREKSAKIAAILSGAKSDASDEIRAAREARQADLATFVDFLENRATRTEQRAARAANSILSQGFNINDLSDDELQTLANNAGVSIEQLKTNYYELEQAQSKEEAEGFTLGEGQVRFDAQGNVIARGAADVGTFKPITVSPGSSIFDPVSGMFLGTAPERPTDPTKPIVEEFNGYQNQWDPTTNSWTVLGSADVPRIDEPKVVDINGVDSIFNRSTGQFEPVKIQQEEGTQVPVRFQEQVDTATSILEHEGLDSAVGPTFAQRIGILDRPSGAKKEFLGLVENLISQITLDKLIEVKGEGATFGALSDQERVELQNAATPLNKWAIRDDDGSIKGFKVKETTFKKEIDRLRKKAEAKTGGATTDGRIRVRLKGTNQTGSIPEEEFDESLYEKISFSGVGADTNTGTGRQSYLQTLGQVTGEGSRFWKHGLDIDLKVGDPVKSPVSGKAIAVGTNRGFGKQVKIRSEDGQEYWLSHLDSFGVKKGDTIQKGQVIGKGGKTGKVIPLAGGDGSHLDITVKDKNGNFVPPSQIRKILENTFV